MQSWALVYVVGAIEVATRLERDLGALNVRCRRFHSGVAALSEARKELPQVVICGPDLDNDTAAFISGLKGEPLLQRCWCLALYSNDLRRPNRLQEDGGPDDFLPLTATSFELRNRVKVGIRVSQAENCRYRLEHELEMVRLEQQRDSEFIQDATTHLVEIAAELQGEIVHNAKIEQQNILTAKSDTIAQAAAALRHEINNPLFAITGSAEAARRRLMALSNATQADFDGVYSCIDRIQRAAMRIQHVVHAISEMLIPTTKDYVVGVPMLDLKPTEPAKDE